MPSLIFSELLLLSDIYNTSIYLFLVSFPWPVDLLSGGREPVFLCISMSPVQGRSINISWKVTSGGTVLKPESLLRTDHIQPAWTGNQAHFSRAACWPGRWCGYFVSSLLLYLINTFLEPLGCSQPLFYLLVHIPATWREAISLSLSLHHWLQAAFQHSPLPGHTHIPVASCPLIWNLHFDLLWVWILALSWLRMRPWNTPPPLSQFLNLSQWFYRPQRMSELLPHAPPKSAEGLQVTAVVVIQPLSTWRSPHTGGWSKGDIQVYFLLINVIMK